MCGDTTNWEESSYRESILKEREIETLTVFRTSWPPSPTATVNPDVIFTACTDGSVASYSVSSCIAKLPLGFGSSKPPQAEPNGFLWAHEGPAYDVKLYGSGEEDALLLRVVMMVGFEDGDGTSLLNQRYQLHSKIITGSEDGTARHGFGIAEVVSVLTRLVQKMIRIRKDRPLSLGALLLMPARAGL